ncbi:MAG: hypothetical protein AB8G99_09195 [Planctomycetaceae bacterium]
MLTDVPDELVRTEVSLAMKIFITAMSVGGGVIAFGACLVLSVLVSHYTGTEAWVIGAIVSVPAALIAANQLNKFLRKRIG